MEESKDIKNVNKMLLGKKRTNLMKKESSKVNETNKDSILFETSTELSVDNLITLEEKVENIPGLDDINIPSFLNDKCTDIDKKIKNYYKTKKELGSNELAKLYLIDISRIYKKGKN